MTNDEQPKLPNTTAERLFLLRKELRTIEKDAVGQTGNQKYSYATITSVLSVLNPLLTKYGLVLTSKSIRSNEEWVLVTSVFSTFSPDDAIQSMQPLHPSRDDPKEWGIVQTYARRYNIYNIFEMSVEDTDASIRARDSGKTGKVRPSPTANGTARSVSKEQSGMVFAGLKKAFEAVASLADYAEVAEMATKMKHKLHPDHLAQLRTVGVKVDKALKAKATAEG